MESKQRRSSLYPPDWDQIAQAIKARANWRCVQCAVPHFLDGLHKNILTVHHLDRDPANSSPENLVALCASCHNRAEARERAKQARATIRRRLASKSIRH